MILSNPPLDTVVTRREGRIGWKTFIQEAPEYGLHEHTVEQELKTVCNRHLFETPEPQRDSQAWKLMEEQIERLARALGRTNRTPVRKLLEGRTGRRRKRFYEGARRYHQNGVEQKDSIITEMQKLEFYEQSKIADKEDRGIQFRSVTYNVALAQYLHQIEERLIGTHYLGFHPVAKGLTPAQRCERLFAFAELFDEPEFYSIDHARFDAHVHEWLLRLEHKVYLYCCRKHPELVRLLRMQRKNKGYTKGGIRYKIRGKRMSGDINTGLGNTILNLCMLLAWLQASGVTKFRILLDGDDSVVIIEKSDIAKLIPIEEFMLQLGMETEMTHTPDIWKVDFCQSRPVLLPTENGPRPVFVRNPLKVITTMGRTAEKRDDVTMQMVMRSSALSELAIAPGAPITNRLARRVLEHYGHGRTLKTAKQLYKEEAYGFNCDDVDAESVVEPDAMARHTFWLAWDIEPSYQEFMEEVDIVWQAPKVREKRERLRPNLLEGLPLEVDDLGQVESRCDCGDCPTYEVDSGCVRWVL